MKSVEALIAFLIVQCSAVVWWASKITARVKMLEESQIKHDRVADDVADIKTDMAVVKAEVIRLADYRAKNL